MPWATLNVFLHQKKDNKTREAEDKGWDRENKGKENLMDPDGWDWLVGFVTGKECMNYWNIGNGEKMGDGDTVRKRSMVWVSCT